MLITERRFLIFEMQDTRYAVDLENIAEVADPPRSWPIPFAPACFTGAIHLHGSIIAVLDLSSFLGLAPCPKPEKIIVLQHGVASMAFLVDKVIQIVPEHDAMIQNCCQSNFASFALLLPEGEVTLLDMDAIVRSVECVFV